MSVCPKSETITFKTYAFNDSWHFVNGNYVWLDENIDEYGAIPCHQVFSHLLIHARTGLYICLPNLKL